MDFLYIILVRKDKWCTKCKKLISGKQRRMTLRSTKKIINKAKNMYKEFFEKIYTRGLTEAVSSDTIAKRLCESNSQRRKVRKHSKLFYADGH